MSTPHILIYSTKVCSSCMRAKQMLKRKNVEFEEVLIDTDADARKKMEELSGRRTVPQIFIDENHVGGFDDLYALDRKGELNALLGIDQD